MSEIPARGPAQRLQDIREGLNALLAQTPEDTPEKQKVIQVAHELFDQLQVLATEDIGNDMLSTLEEWLQIENASTVDVPAEDVTLHEQAVASFEKFQLRGELDDLERAVTSWQRAVDLTPDDHEYKPWYLNNLGNALEARFHRQGSLADLEDAIAQIRKALDLIPEGHPSKSVCLSSLGAILTARFERYGSPADLEEAILQKRKAVDLTLDDNPSKPGYLSNLGNTLELRFDHHGVLADLEDAILQKRKALKLTPEDHADMPLCLNNLGSALETRFDRCGSLADLEEAILQRRKAVDLTLDEHPNKPLYLKCLGSALESRFKRYGSLVDLEDAILQKRKAVNLIPDDHSQKAAYLVSLGAALETRFDRYGSLVDLEEAILLSQKAVNLVPDDHLHKPNLLGSLASTLEKSFERRGSLADLENAILEMRKAINLLPEDHPDIPMYLNVLGYSMEARFRRNGLAVDLEDAIAQMQRAINLTPDDHPSKPKYLTSLGNALESKFNHEQALPDLENSILQRREAVRLMPKDHFDRAACLNNLGSVLQTRFERSGDQRDLQDAISAARESAESPVASSRTKFRGASIWAGCCVLGSMSSLPAFEHAIKLLPRIAWLGLALDDQYFLLARSGVITRCAVEAATLEGEYAKAIEWAEQGRSVVWQNLLSLRTPLEELRGRHPKLAMQLQELSDRLEQPAKTWDALDGEKPSGTADKQISLAIERENLIEEVRKKPGFGGFMQTKSLEQLAPAARDGPVIFLNLGDVRCDALALLPGDNGAAHVVPIPLEHVTSKKAEKLTEKLVSLLSKTGVRARGIRKHKVHGEIEDKNVIFKDILRTLWLDYVRPVLDGLGYQVNLEAPPRVWWCTTGPLAFLPLHAAGLYDSKEVGHKVSDYIVSSYTPTLTALLDKPSAVLSKELKILTVAISNTPGAPLPCTEKEVQALQRLAVNLPVVSLTNEQATDKRVLKELKMSNWAHLACHGEQVGGKPMESGLILHEDKLMLSEIVKARLPGADFAFLSACQTAVGDGGVPEESAHLAAGMLFAGFRGVVATMWSIQDDIAPRVTKDFYQYMFRHGQPKREEAAYALHKAVRSLQESGVPFASWVPFIHIGR